MTNGDVIAHTARTRRKWIRRNTPVDVERGSQDEMEWTEWMQDSSSNTFRTVGLVGDLGYQDTFDLHRFGLVGFPKYTTALGIRTDFIFVKLHAPNGTPVVAWAGVKHPSVLCSKNAARVSHVAVLADVVVLPLSQIQGSIDFAHMGTHNSQNRETYEDAVVCSGDAVLLFLTTTNRCTAFWTKTPRCSGCLMVMEAWL